MDPARIGSEVGVSRSDADIFVNSKVAISRTLTTKCVKTRREEEEMKRTLRSVLIRVG